MKIPKKIFLFFFIIVGLIYYFFFYISINDQKKIYTFLIFSEEEKKVANAWVLYYYYPFAYFHLFEIHPQHHVFYQEKYQLINQDKNFFENRIKDLLSIRNFDFTINLEEGLKEDIFNIMGGINFINLHSEAFPLGKVFIDNLNYQRFLNGIENSNNRKNTRLSIWLNALFHVRDNVIANEAYLKQLRGIFNLLNININYQSFLKLFNPFLQENSNFIINYDKMNFDTIKQAGEEYLVPLNNGKYDLGKINQTLTEFVNQEIKYQLFPIAVQIKNATTINRLATRTTGIFRYRRLNIDEYLNSDFLLNNSVIVSYIFSPLKENYIKKVSKIEDVYYLIDYTKEFDFSIYLGKDFYGIKSTQENEQN